MYRKLCRWFWRMVPHECRGPMIATKYGCSAFCQRCGRSQTMMDAYPWGD